MKKFTIIFIPIILAVDLSAQINKFGVSLILNGSFYSSIDKDRRIPTITSNQTSIPEFGYDMNEISFEWTTPYFTEELSTEYSYKLGGLEENLSKWEGFSSGKYIKKEYNNLPF